MRSRIGILGDLCVDPEKVHEVLVKGMGRGNGCGEVVGKVDCLSFQRMKAERRGIAQ